MQSPANLKTNNIQKILIEIFDEQKKAHQQNQLTDIIDYTLKTTGKMLRGLMLLEAYKLVGGNPEQIMSAAAAIESGHLASLIHDDLMDNDRIRRGTKTIWSQFNKNTAILTGNLFIFEAFYSFTLCAKTVPADRVVKGLEVLSQTGIDLCFGQALEAQLTGDCSASINDYIKMVHYKTGKLFGAALKSGAILGGAPEDTIAALTNFGENLGIAFQIIDDLLPYTNSTEKKATFSDFLNRRMTLPIIYALSSTKLELVTLLTLIFSKRKKRMNIANQMELQTLTSVILQQTNAVNQTKQDAIHFFNTAIQFLMTLPDSESRNTLKLIAENIIDRIN